MHCPSYIVRDEFNPKLTLGGVPGDLATLHMFENSIDLVRNYSKLSVLLSIASSVVMMEKVRTTSLLAGSRHRSHRPAKANRLPSAIVSR
jgi:hypothetical protein